MWEDFGVRETLGQVVKQEKNVIWLKENKVRRNCTDARTNIVKAPNLDLHINIQNKHLLSTRAAGVTLRAPSISLQASVTLLSYKQLFPFYR